MTEADDIADRIVQVAANVAFVAVAAQTTLYLVDAALPGSRRLLDADHDLSVFSWLAVAAAALAAAAALGLAAILREQARSYYALAAVLAFLSLDDMVQIHEDLGVRARISGVEYSERFIWPIIYLPLLAVTFLLLETIARRAHRTVRRLIRVGLALLAAAIVLELAAGAVLVQGDSSRLTAVYILEVAIEEAAELAGWVAIATALSAGFAVGLVRSGAAAREAGL